MDKAYHPAILYRAAEDFYEFAMAHGVEETLQVEIDHIDVAIINYFLRTSQGIMATSSRAEAVSTLLSILTLPLFAVAAKMISGF